MTVNDLVGLAKNLADMIVYVWGFSLLISLLLGQSLNQVGSTFRMLPGFWAPSMAEPINQTARSPIENAESYLLLGGLLLLRGTRDLVVVTLIALLVDCFSSMLFARKSRAVCSNILFTFLGFLLLRGYFEPGIIAILMTILVGCLFSKMLWGMVPSRRNNVWMGHLVSFVGGAIAARFLDAIVVFLPVSQFW